MKRDLKIIKLLNWLRDSLCEKGMMNLNPNALNRLTLHKQALNRKPILRHVFEEFHHEIKNLDQQYSINAQGISIELGAGVYPIKNSYPQVLATDIVEADHLDRVLDALNMDVDSGSVRAIYGQNCFHHFPEPSKFFNELERVLASGGVAILIEPYYGLVASFLFKHLFSAEDFNKNGEWNIAENDKPNQALSYIIFERDRKIFKKNFNELEIVYQRPLTNYLRYLLSGGLNFKTLVPRRAEGPIKLLEFCLTPMLKIFALHHIIVLRRK